MVTCVPLATTKNAILITIIIIALLSIFGVLVIVILIAIVTIVLQTRVKDQTVGAAVAQLRNEIHAVRNGCGEWWG